MAWVALGEYRGPKSAGIFIRYAVSRMQEEERRECHRIYMAKHMQLLAGTDVDYYELVEGHADFDAEEVVDYVISRMGLEEET